MRTGLRATGVLALSALLVGVGGAVASAHVTVAAPGAVSGGSDQVITFRVPTESATASTIALTVQLPAATPIASVLVAPHPGWTDKVTSTQLATPIQTDDGDITTAVSTIEWTATSTANGIAPGQFGEFVIMAGLLPKTTSLTFKAIQRYSDNSTVSWVEVAAAGSDEPEHPAPVLTLAPAAGAGSTASASTSAPATSPAASSPATSGSTPAASSDPAAAAPADSSDLAKQSDVTTALIIAAIAVVLAAVGLGVGFAGWRRTRP